MVNSMRKVTKYFFAVDRDLLWNSLMSLKSNSKRQNEFVVKQKWYKNKSKDATEKYRVQYKLLGESIMLLQAIFDLWHGDLKHYRKTFACFVRTLVAVNDKIASRRRESGKASPS